MTEFVEKVQIVGADGTPLTVNADGSIDVTGGGGGGGTVDTVVAGTNITVDATDPANPVVAAPSVIANSLADAKGDLIAATAADTWARVAVGANGAALIAASGATPGVNWAYPPGYEFGYDQITTNVTVSSTTEASGNTVISCAAHTFDGAPVVAEFFTPRVECGSTGFVIVCLFEGATELGQLAVHNTTSGSASGRGSLRFTPTAGSHTYTVTAFRVNNNGTIHAGSGGTAAVVPTYIRFTKV